MNRELFAKTALKYLGYPSINCKGHPEFGCDPSGFDCSGFILFLLKEIGFPLSQTIRHVSTFFDYFGVSIHEKYAGKGDLVFLSRDGTKPTHIGIMLDDKNYIHAPGKLDTRVQISKIPHEEIRIKPGAIYHRNPIGFKRLALPNGRWQQPLS